MKILTMNLGRQNMKEKNNLGPEPYIEALAKRMPHVKKEDIRMAFDCGRGYAAIEEDARIERLRGLAEAFLQRAIKKTEEAHRGKDTGLD